MHINAVVERAWALASLELDADSMADPVYEGATTPAIFVARDVA
jgi:hypothetical protein